VDDFQIHAFASRAAWREWLDEQHTVASGIWLKLAKAGSGIESVSYEEVVEVALCYGWIDGQTNRVDDDYYLQRCTPRRARSKWSKINRAKAEVLIANGMMQPGGLREVERAQADGRWEAAYDSPRSARVPRDLQDALDLSSRARELFATLDGRNRYAILHRIQDAKKPETRARRIERFVAMLAAGETLYP